MPEYDYKAYKQHYTVTSHIVLFKRKGAIALLISKGDLVKLESGVQGEVLETWGIARSFARIRLDDGTSIPIFQSEIKAIVKVKAKAGWGRG